MNVLCFNLSFYATTMYFPFYSASTTPFSGLHYEIMAKDESESVPVYVSVLVWASFAFITALHG